MVAQFATLDAYQTYTGEPGTVLLPRQLKSAALLVGRATRFARYAVGSDGLPTDTRLADALRDAMCEVLRHRDDVGVSSPLSAAGLQSAGIGSATYVVASGAEDTFYVIPVDAWLILEDAGLLDVEVTVCG